MLVDPEVRMDMVIEVLPGEDETSFTREENH